MKPIVLIDFTKQSDDELSISSQHIIDCMTGNTNYPGPIPSLEATKTSKGEFDTSLAAAQFGGIEKTAAKNLKRTALEENLKTLGLYVQMNCKNNLSILLSSGFSAKRNSEHIGVLDKPKNFRVEQGPFQGSLKLTVNAVKGANIYVYQMTEAPVTPQSQWTIKLGKKSIIIEGLIPGKEYAFRVAAKGTAEGEVYSDIITHFVA